VRRWREVVAVSCGDWHSVGVTSDGTTLAVGISRPGQCEVDGWGTLTDVAAGYLHTVGLQADGRAMATGDRTSGACDVDQWTDVVALSAGSYHTVGVTAAFGLALAVGDNSFGQCEVSAWRDIVAVSAGSTHTIGLRADATVVSTGNNADGQCDVDTWSEIPGSLRPDLRSAPSRRAMYLAMPAMFRGNPPTILATDSSDTDGKGAAAIRLAGLHNFYYGGSPGEERAAAGRVTGGGT
jgi:Regulator of chromosome condensation (RCC1) repeat